jgi:hypothetical protein
MRIGLIWFMVGPKVELCEHGNETSGYLKDGDLLN